jgi:2-C-methyl-D-erythritol 2,4-cyclodiphosphate synthase
LVLGGVPIPHNRGLLGHSDADVVLHALSDALLGAASLGDLGDHFPVHDHSGVSLHEFPSGTNRDILVQRGMDVDCDSFGIPGRAKIHCALFPKN